MIVFGAGQNKGVFIVVFFPSFHVLLLLSWRSVIDDFYSTFGEVKVKLMDVLGPRGDLHGTFLDTESYLTCASQKIKIPQTCLQESISFIV